MQFLETALFSVSLSGTSPILFTNSPNGLCFYFFHLFLLFFLPHSSHQVTINANQLVLTFVRKYDFNSSHWKASPASSICFAGFLAIFQQDHLMSQDKVWIGPTWCNAHPTISPSSPQKRSSIQLFS